MRILTKCVVMAIAIAASFEFVGCASHKKVADKTSGSKSEVAAKDNGQVRSLAFVQKVDNQKVTAKNIVGKMTLTVKAGSKEISAPGSLSMRYNEVIRIQAFIPFLGSEVGRIEFTPDYVLVVDRMHKEYIKANYNDVDFLKGNGLNFYSLQALFWNQLFMPGKQKLEDAQLMDFTVSDAAYAGKRNISFSNGNMEFVWIADAENGQISVAEVAYKSLSHGNSALHCDYSKFKSVDGKMFPAYQSFSFTTTAIKTKGTTSLTLDMGNIKTDDKWDVHTTVSSKYKKVEATDILGKLFSK